MSSEEGSHGRCRRQVSQKLATRLSALEKLKKLKGGKNKYEMKEEIDVYEEVDEEEYSEMVCARRDEEWIVDDGMGGEYMDDGREIFDDYDSDDGNIRGKQHVRDDKKKIPLKRFSQKEQKESKKNDIRSMFLSAGDPRKKGKSFDEVKINESELDGILESIHSNEKASTHMNCTPKPMKLTKKVNNRQTNMGSASVNPFATKRKHDDDLSPSSSRQRGCDEPDSKRRILKKNITDDFDFDDVLGNDFNKHELIGNINDKKLTQADDEIKPTVIKSEPNASNSFDCEWNASANNEIQSAPMPAVLPKDLPFEMDKDNNKYIKFYWFDAYTDQYKNTGTVYLFGKIWIKEIKRHVSCCILLKNIEKRVYLLPRKHFVNDPDKKVTIQDVYNEFSESIATKLKITNFRTKKVTKRYAFEHRNIPAEADYLEILYPSNFPSFPDDLTSGNTFSHVFGANTSPLEHILIDCKLKGPGWLKIKNPEISDPPISWCKLELIINKPKSQIELETEKIPSPDFTLVSLNLKTFLNPNSKLNEVIAVSCLVNQSFNFEKPNSKSKYDSHFCIITKPSNNCGVMLPYDFTQGMALKNYKRTKVDPMNSERELLNFFMAKFHQIDPDIIVGHDIYEFDYELLLSRFAHYKIMNWSKLGRLRRSGLPNKARDKNTLCGRILCDIKISSRELIRAKSYDLTQLSTQILKKGRFEVEQHLLPSFYSSSSQLLRLIDLIMKDNEFILSIMLELNALQLALQITSIAGNLLSRTLLGGRSERNEYLLLHAFNEKNFICPDKVFASNKNYVVDNVAEENNGDEGFTQKGKTVSKNASRNQRKAAYTGGLVLEPKVGFYDKFILLMDFNSLYPSIIQEYNICFTTVSRKQTTENDVDPEEYIPELPDPDALQGILPEEIKKLVESRKEVKRLMCSPNLTEDAKQQYDIRQKALKLTANSMYGCLGFSHSRFYAKPLAALITYKGREILMHTKQLVEKLGLEVIYGDTDSIMILTNCTNYDEVKTIGSKVQSEVNRLYKLLEIDIDGVFRSMLLLKKKKYAALTVQKTSSGEMSFSKEVKGLDIVRRDWSILAKTAGDNILNEILSTENSTDMIVDKIHNYLKELSASIRNGDIPIEDFIITKSLTKNPEDYPDKKSLSHVAVALRYNASGMGKKLRSGDTVPYIICEDVSQPDSKLPATQRAFHPQELKDNTNLKLDVNYYLSQQILPVVSRLCDPLDGTDSHILAEFMGIESSFKGNVNRSLLETEAALEQGEHKYDTCKSLVFTCVNEDCNKEIEIRSIFKEDKIKGLGENNGQSVNKPKYELTFARCPHCNIEFNDLMAPKFEMQLRLLINKLISEFYQNWMICEDPTCYYRTRYFTGKLSKTGPLCPECKNAVLYPEVTEAQLNHQLVYYKHLLDLDAAINLFNLTKDDGRNLKVRYSTLYDKLKRVVQDFLNASSYNEVDLNYLFKKFALKITGK